MKYVAAAMTMMLVMFGVNPARARAADLFFNCPYPGTGHFVRADVIIVTGEIFVCDYPQEINGAHSHQELIDLDVGFNIGFAISSALGNAGITIGGEGWTSSWRCPDERYLAKQPNPVGAWNHAITPTSCEAIGVAGLAKRLMDVPWPPIRGSTDIPFEYPPSIDPGSPPPQISSPEPIPDNPGYFSPYAPPGAPH